MKSGIRKKKLVLVIVFFVLLLLPMPVISAEFFADVIQNKHGKTMQGRFFLKGNLYRMDIEDHGKPISVLVDLELGKTKVLIHSEKIYLEFDNTNIKTLSNNPFQAFKHTADRYKFKSLGNENINGYMCKKQLINTQGRDLMTAWWSEKLYFYVKIVNHLSKGMFTELRNIEQEVLPAKIFQAPSDYRKMANMPKMKKNQTGASQTTSQVGPITNNFQIKSKEGRANKYIPLNRDRNLFFKVADDNADGKDTRGKIVFYTTAAVKNNQGRISYVSEKFKEVDFVLENGRSESWQFPADHNISSAKITLMQGSGVSVLTKQSEKATKINPSSKIAPDSGDTDNAQADKPSVKPAESGSPANIMFIFDASGSMWGRVEGKEKIVIAKEVMINLINDLPDNTRVGLVAYGHRRKGDCNDIEQLVALSSVDKIALAKTINAINPKGKTPITKSVEFTAEKLRVLEDETTIILVSDGKESCEGDPCALVKELKKSGLKFIMHVIGFDVTKEVKAQLECMAKAGGGKYFTAKTASDFQRAANEVVQETRNTGYLKISAIKKDKPFKAFVRIFKKGEKKEFQTGWTEIEKMRIFRLGPGIYNIKVEDSSMPDTPTVSVKDIEIKLGKTLEKKISFEQNGYLKIAAEKNGNLIRAYLNIYRHGEKRDIIHQNLKKGNFSTFKLLAGLYDIQVEDTSVVGYPEVFLKAVEISGGQTLEKKIQFKQNGILKAIAMKEGKSVKAYYKLYKLGQDKRLTHGYLKKNKGYSFKLSPGVYQLQAETGGLRREQSNIIIKPGETNNVEIKF